MNITFASQVIRLLPSGALFFEQGQVLVLADLHLGKMLALQDVGIPGHAFSDLPTIKKLKQDVSVYKPKKVILLGDVFHQNSRHMPQLLDRFFEMLKALVSKIVITVGNHDQGLLNIKSSGAWCCVNAYHWAGIHFAHEPVDHVFCMAGHIHPGIKLKKGKLTKVHKAFLLNKQQFILPAYGLHTGVSPVKYSYQQAFVIKGDHIIPTG